MPFNDAGNPVMAQVAFLTAMVSPKIAAAAAQRALEVNVLIFGISSAHVHQQWVSTQHRGAARRHFGGQRTAKAELHGIVSEAAWARPADIRLQITQLQVL